ncbi:hypothetical protein SK128_004531, partial [Halocaridina rubra]
LESIREKKDILSLVSSAYFDYNYGKDCRFLKLPRGYFSTFTSFAVRKGWPIKNILNKV